MKRQTKSTEGSTSKSVGIQGGGKHDVNVKISRSRNSILSLRKLYEAFLENGDQDHIVNEPINELGLTDNTSTVERHGFNLEEDDDVDSSDESSVSSTEDDNSKSTDNVDELNDKKDDLVAQIQSLHRQLHVAKQVPNDIGAKIDSEHETDAEILSKHDAPESEAFAPVIVTDNAKVIVCSVGNPVSMRRSDVGAGWEYRESHLPLKSAIDFLSSTNNVTWVSWPGTEIDGASKDGVRTKLMQEYNCVPAFIGEEITGQCMQFCQNVLWPVFHNMQDQIDYMALSSIHDGANAYQSFNHKYLDVVANAYEAGDVVMVYGYHLMLLPGLLRRRFPDIKCVFFYDTPFPSAEMWAILSMREELLGGVLGSDLVAFHHYNYVRHFIHTCAAFLGLDTSPRFVEYDRRLIMLTSLPLGIDPQSMRLGLEEISVVESLHTRFSGMKVIVASDSLDFVNGIPEKLSALETFLEDYPEWRGKIVLCQVLIDEKLNQGLQSVNVQSLSRRVNELIGRVNGKYGDINYHPVQILRRSSISREELMALYNIADIALITSLRQGLNRCAFEYVVCQNESNPGVLIYSEFAGCADLWKGALQVNPYHADQIARTISRGLGMSLKRRQTRHKNLIRCVETFSSKAWTNHIFPTLIQASLRSRENQIMPHLIINHMSNAFHRARKRLILMDFRGTLLPFQPIPQLNKPTEHLIKLLTGLAEDERNDVFILGGVSMDTLERNLGHIDELGLVAEHGFFIRYPAKSNNKSWKKVRPNLNLWWMKDVVSVLECFSDRTPGSYLEVGESCVTWHFRDTDKQFGMVQAKLLQIQLEQMLQYQPAQAVLIFEQDYIIIHSTGIHKGTALRHIINTSDKSNVTYDVILSFGDDRTDESMFKQLAKYTMTSSIWSCSVNNRVNCAQYYVENVDIVMEVLSSLVSLPVGS